MRAKDISDIQIVNRKSKKYTRGVPETIFKPTKAQAEARVKFGEIARKYQGKGLTPKEIAQKIKEEFKGFRSSKRKIKIPKYVKRLSKVAEMEKVSKDKLKEVLERLKSI